MTGAERQQLEGMLRKLSIPDAKAWMAKHAHKALLREYWNDLYPGVEPFNVGEILHVAITGISPFCANGKHKNFKQFPFGFFNACSPNKECACYFEMRSAIMKETASKETPEQKEKRKLAAEKTNMERYGVKNPFQMSDHLQKTNATIRERYGVDSLWEIPGHADRISETSMKNYGVLHPKKSKIVNDKAKATNLEKYGTVCALYGEEAAAKTKATMLERYGVKNYFDSHEHQEQIRQHREETLGYRYIGQRFLSPETLAILQDKEKFAEIVKDRSYEYVATVLNTSAFTISNYAKQYDLVETMKLGHGSAMQEEIFEWIQSIGLSAIKNTRKVIPPKEIDIYLPDFKFGIEYNGSYHHSELNGRKPPSYHRDKFVDCENAGIELIQICSTVYLKKKNAVRSLILDRLGMSECSIMATDCRTAEVCFDDAFAFCKEHAIKNLKENVDIMIGLYHADELVQLMAFSKVDEGEWVLDQYATKYGTTVADGLLTIFQQFISMVNPVKVTYRLDLQYFSSKKLEDIGFAKTDNPIQINYQYTGDYYSLHDPQIFKTAIEVESKKDPSLTEWDIMQSREWDRIWDSGNLVLAWTPKFRYN